MDVRRAVAKYAWNLLISVDQLFNTVLGGYPDETMSSRMGKRLVTKKDCVVCVVLCRLLGYIDENHCKESIEWDEGAQRPEGGKEANRWRNI